LIRATDDGEMQALEVSKNKMKHALATVDRELRFTEAHRTHEKAHPLVREVECLRVQIPGSLLPIEDADWFAGTLDRPYVGIDPEHGDLTEAAYYCYAEALREQLDEPSTPEALRNDIRFLLDYWAERTTWRRCRRAFPERLTRGLPTDDYYRGTQISYPMFGLGGPMLDFGKLVRLGIAGLREEIRRRAACDDDEARIFYDSLSAAMDLFASAATRYADEAERKAAEASSEDAKARLRVIAESCRHIAARAPESYHQAIQLVWLYTLVALPKNYGRMDVYLGDLLAHDLDHGVLTPEQALEMTVGLWKQILRRGNNFNNRLIVGGLGRPNPENADRFTLLALEAQGILGNPIPQIALRWHAGMDPAIWDKALEVIGKGSTQPMLYNDDVNVPGVARGFEVPMDEAQQYVMYGCGEYVIDHKSVGSPDAAINLVKALNVTLFNGRDPFFDEAKGLALGELKDFPTFEAFRDAFARQIHNEIGLLAEAQALITRVTGEEAGYPLLSLLYDDCLERGKPLLAGGVRYVGGTCEAFGASTVSDSLVGIRRAIYDDAIVSADELLEALKSDFAGREPLQRRLLAYPKFGNDNAEADEMNLWFNEFLCESCRKHGRRVGLDSFLVVLINNGDSVMFGKSTLATPDGRNAGRPVANGNQPGAGYDQSGLTALLNSMGKLDASVHAGVVHNVKLSRGTFQDSGAKVSAMMRGYFASGGTQAMVTVTDRGELERAMKEPQNYTNLVVRVGGYSERFIDLPRDVQLEVIRRTLY
jgi:pyruvate-formate lyase